MTPGNDALRKYLRSILVRTAALHVGAGMVSFLATFSWVLLAVIVWTAAVETPGLTTAVVVARATLILAAALFAYFVVWPLVRMPRLNQLASEIERRQDLKELVRAGFEFSHDPAAAQRYSPELVREVIRQAIEKLSGLKVRALFLNRRDLMLVPVALGGLAGLTAFALFDPSVVARAGRRVVSPEAVALAPHRPNLLARPGNVTVLAGSDVTVSGLDLGQSDMPVEVSFNLSADFWKTEPTTLVHGAEAGADAFDHYDYTFRDLRNSIAYYFQAGDYQSETCTITVVHEPILTDVRVTLTPPAYTREAPTTLAENAGNVQVLEGTRVKVEARSNNPLRAAWVQFDEKEKQPVAHTNRDLSFDFTALSDGHYKVLLEDSLGFATRDPLAYTVEVFQDRPPTVDVLEPGEDTAMPRNQQIDLGFIAADDYGAARASLHFRKAGEEGDFRKLAIPLGEQKNRKEIAVAYRWDLAAVALFPGNSVEYFVEVADNNIVTGPGIGRSRLFRITVPTIAELYDNAHEEQANRTESLKTAIEDSRELSDQLEKISREYLKTEKMDWTQKKELDRAVEKQQAVEEKLGDVKESLDKTLQELSDNEMTSQQIGEKLEEIRDLMEQIDSAELKKYMDELRKAMDSMSPEEIKQALENLEMNTEEMLQRLERTASLLKQLQKEQQMEDLVRKSQNLMEKQSELNQETGESSPENQKQMDELAKRQDDLARQAEAMEKSTDELAKDMQEDAQVQDQLQQMAQEMQQKGPKPHMDKASKDLSQQQKKSAMQEQQQALDEMVGLFKRAQQAQQAMSQNQGQKTAMNFQRFAKQTLELSFRQETLAGDLKNSAGEGEPQSPQMKAFAQDQLSYLQATERVADEIAKLSNLTMQVPAALMEAMGNAINRMQNSVLFLEQDKPYMSTTHAHNAVESLNLATIEMLRSAKNCTSGSGSGQQSQAMQMLQQMIPQQQDIVRETQSMMQLRMTEEALRQQRQAQLERLSGQQRSLQEVAKQIQESLKNNREALGKLDRTIEEMEAVANALNQGAVNEDLVNKEQRILSRLLDADRSVHTRDYEKQRESVTAEDVFSKSLGKRPDAAGAQTLRDEIQRAMQLKAPGEFEDLIRLYFRALAEEPAGDTPRSE